MDPQVQALWVTVLLTLGGLTLNWIGSHREKDRLRDEQRKDREAEETRRRLEAGEVARWKENVILRVGQLEGFKEDTRAKHAVFFDLMSQIDRRLSHIEGAVGLKVDA